MFLFPPNTRACFFHLIVAIKDIKMLLLRVVSHKTKMCQLYLRVRIMLNIFINRYGIFLKS